MASKEDANLQMAEVIGGVDAQESVRLPVLPEELVSEILLRLPVNSLAKFKCVRKSWLSLISTPEFAKAHLKISVEKNRGEPNALAIANCARSGVALFASDIDSFLHEIESYHAAEVPGDIMVDSVTIIDSSYGLICLCLRVSVIFLWNPNMGKLRKLPPSGVSIDHVAFSLTYGFTYDELNDDYNVVENYGGLGPDGYTGEVRVYSLRTNSWRSIKRGPRELFPDKHSVFFNGAFHWPDRCHGVSSVISLNLVTETYDEVPMPNHDPVCFDDMTLGVLRRHFCIFLKYHTYSDVWMMNQYGVGESWSRCTRIMHADNWINPLPLYMSEDGIIILNCGATVKLYNSSGNSSISEHNPSRNTNAYVEAIAYTESLFWPFSYNEGNQKPGGLRNGDEDWGLTSLAEVLQNSSF